MTERHLFTSESVSEGHPDKVADQVSDAILDAILEKDPMARVACETSVTTGLVLVFGEISTTAYVDIQKIVRQTVNQPRTSDKNHQVLIPLNDRALEFQHLALSLLRE